MHDAGRNAFYRTRAGKESEPQKGTKSTKGIIEISAMGIGVRVVFEFVMCLLCLFVANIQL